ncbi:MAG: MG2 domain-containing protein, partial [Burkholderiales bacterium]
SLRLGQALLDARAPMFVRSGVLVTNLGVHFKLGRANSVAWVTTLNEGRPVADAKVAVYDCRGKPLWSGRTDADGLARIDQRLTDAANNTQGDACLSEYGLFVTARSTDAQGVQDVAFVFSNWQQGIEPWRFNLPTADAAAADVRAATVFDRTLLRAGETVSMKHFVRRETLQGLAELAADELPTERKIVHRGSEQEFSEELVWRGPRSASSAWQIPPAAKLGVYDVTLVRAAKDNGLPEAEWSAGSFRVEQFRLPLVDARLSGPKQPLVAPQAIPLALQLNYFSGGGMKRVPAQVSAVLKSTAVAFDGYDDFSFAPPRDAQRSGGRANEDSGDTAEISENDNRLIADKQPLVTDDQGAASITLGAVPMLKGPARIDAEVTFNDPNGETATVSNTFKVWPSNVVPGIRTAGWASRGGKVELTALALDTAGKPLAGQLLEVTARLTRVISTRKRMVGGFYAYDNRNEVTALGTVCSGRSDAQGRLVCQAELKASGQVELIVQAKDDEGRIAQAAAEVTVSAEGDLWFAQSNDDRVDVLPDKRSYEPGETAKLQVRMPFRDATALVAVEREGVLDTRVVTLRGNDPNFELKIEPGWGPNVYVSVLSLRGRIREVPWYSFFTWGWREPRGWVRNYYDNLKRGAEYRPPSTLVDLGKPAFKFGVAALKVGIGAHRLQVDVRADQPVHQVREKAQVRIKVAFDGQPVASASVAFAAVDEGLLALRDNESWDLLGQLIRERAWGVQTATAQSEIVGRRHYGRKAVAAGGGGGKGGTRELFDTLLVWRADVALDANGEATIEVPLNDSLTTFRLVAVADDGAARFGTGSTSIRVTQDLQVLAGLPPLVRTGDAFDAMLTLRNTTSRAMNIRASLQGTANGVALLALPAKDVLLAPDAAQELSWPVRVPADASAIDWLVTAQEQAAKPVEAAPSLAASGPAAPLSAPVSIAAASAASVSAGTAPQLPAPTQTTPAARLAQDRIRIRQRVQPAVPERVLQATVTQLDGAFALPVAPPADALPEAGVKRGGIVVAVQPKLSGALPGLRRFFEIYPFICLEQQVSKAVGLNDQKLWQSVIDALPTYLDSDGLAGYFPPRADAGAGGSDTLTAYLLAASHDAGFTLPDAARAAMLDGLAAFVEGRIERRQWAPPSAGGSQLAVRKLAAIAALARHGRAVPRQLGSIALTPNVWPTAALIDWLRILQAVPGIPNRAKRLAEANQILKSRLSYAGTTLKFSSEASDFWWWLMDSADANAARLILAVLDDPDWKDELPRMVVGALGRQRGGAWLTTTANLWGKVALDKFSARFEAEPVAGGTLAKLGSGSQLIAWDKQPGGSRITLPWPVQPAELDVTHIGTGRPWLTVQSVAAIPLKAPLASGYRVTRTVSAVAQKVAGQWSRGDVLRVRLEVAAQADMTWVVLSDPVPGGATILGSGLGRDSAIADAAAGGDTKDWSRALPSYVERSFDAYRSYYEFLPRGTHVVEYTVRLNNPGTFALPPTRVEAMYAPDSFGESPNATMQVAP